MFFARSILVFALLFAASVLAADPSAADLDVVEQAFIDAGLSPSVVPSFNLGAFFIVVTVDDAGNEIEAFKSPGGEVSIESLSTIPIMATQGKHHLKGSRVVAFVLDPDDEMAQIRMMFAQNLSVREDVPFNDVDMGAHLLNNVVTLTPPANPFISPVASQAGHRLVWLAFDQPAVFDFDGLVDLADRDNFNVADFAAETGLGAPFAATFFTLIP